MQSWYVLTDIVRACVRVPLPASRQIVLDYLAAYEAAAIQAARDGMAGGAAAVGFSEDHGDPAKIKRLQQLEADVAQAERSLRAAFFYCHGRSGEARGPRNAPGT